MRKFGTTEELVSVFGLGTMTFGEQTEGAEAHAQLDYALDQGVNFLDTAELYAIPPRPETQGRSEEIIGEWLKQPGRRARVFLATKVNGRSAEQTWFRRSGAGTALTPAQIDEALEGSLKRLGTDYVDLYQLHWPDRGRTVSRGQRTWPSSSGGGGGSEDPETVPLENQLEALAKHVSAGRVRYIGLSNETPWGVAQFLHLAKTNGWPRIQSIQNAYNLVNRTFELGLAEFAERERVGLLGYSPLAQGYLTGKYEGGALPPAARKTLFNRLGRYEGPNAPEAIGAYLALARQAGLSPLTLALGFAASRPFMTSVLLGARTLAQLKEDLEAGTLPLSADVLAEIDRIHARYPNPCP